VVSSRGEQDAVRAAGAAGATRSLVLYFTMAMAGAIAAAGWRSPPPLAGSYGVDVDSTRLDTANAARGFARTRIMSAKCMPNSRSKPRRKFRPRLTATVTWCGAGHGAGIPS